ncbi:hypothetical protein HDU93_007073 [Gonapodya sp. JEL0774]|nr:hypothetical protein HDU93_007073 [Gonapodya sp. JEL0774]
MPVKRSRVAIVGAGSVGAAIAYACMLRGVPAEILLVDIVEDAVKGQVLDLSDAQFVQNVKVKQGSFPEAGQSDIIIITAGAKQKPGESRIEVDILTSLAQSLSGLPSSQVFGSGTFLDSERLRVYIAEKLKVSETSVHAFALGEHGDSQFIAWSAASVGGAPVLNFPEFKDADLAAIQKSISHKAYDIIALKGATYFGIGGTRQNGRERYVDWDLPHSAHPPQPAVLPFASPFSTTPTLSARSPSSHLNTAFATPGPA